MESNSNEVYFRSYEELSVHELMIKDKPRTESYMRAIEGNPELIKGKIIMDVGAGTGILSMFAARAGAKKVYAIEASKMADIAKKLVKDNGLDHIIEVIECRVEELQLTEKVDVIISEWMGFYLLHESMLNSVVFARDRFLKPETGTMFPCSAQIYAGVISMDEYYNDKIEYWKSVYGFNFSAIVPSATQAAVAGNAVVDVTHEQLLSSTFLIEDLDLMTITLEELREIKQECFFSTSKSGNFHAFCIWFDVTFPSPDGEEPFILSTAPSAEQTHWQQFVLKMPEAMVVEKDTFIESVFTFTQDEENPRFYNVSAQLTGMTCEAPEEEVDESLFVLPGHEPGCSCAKCNIARAFVSQQDAMLE